MKKSFDIELQPNVMPWPPMIYAIAAVAAFGAAMVAPASFPPGPAVRAIGVAMLAIGATLDLWAAATMWRSKTNIMPNRPAKALVSTGPFRLTRNPIYVGNTIALAGLGGIFDNAWFVAAALAAAIAVDRLAIAREELHLAKRFGADWQEYARRTPRWLGR